MTADLSLPISANRSLSSKCARRRRSYFPCKCKCGERLRVCRCRGDSDRFSLSVTVRLASIRLNRNGTRSPWHSDASLPPCRCKAPRGASGSKGGASSDGAKGAPLAPDGARAEEERFDSFGLAGSGELLEVGRQGQITSQGSGKPCGCQIPARGCVSLSRVGIIDLTLARWIGRIWTRPGRGNISPSAREGQLSRAVAASNLCVFRGPGRATTHTFRVSDPQVGRGLRRASVGAL